MRRVGQCPGLVAQKLGGGFGVGDQHEDPQVPFHGGPPLAEPDRAQLVEEAVDLRGERLGRAGGEVAEAALGAPQALDALVQVVVDLGQSASELPPGKEVGT